MRRTWRLRPSWIVSSISSRPQRAAPARGPWRRPRAPRPRAGARSAALADGAAADARAVGLGHLEARVREPVGELAVVGQQDQAAAVGVEAADRVQPRAGAGRVDDRRAPVGVARGRDDARPACCSGVDDALLGPASGAPVDARRRSSSPTSRAGSVTDLAVDASRARRRSSLGRAPRGDAGVGEVLGQAHAIRDATMAQARRCEPHGPPTAREDARRRAASRAFAPARCGRGPRVEHAAMRR